MKRTPFRIRVGWFLFITFSFFVSSLCAFSSAIVPSEPCEEAIYELSKKNFYHFPDLHNDHKRAYLHLLGDARMPEIERVLLWHYYLLRLMSSRFFVGYEVDDTCFDLRSVPELYKKRWHRIKCMTQKASFRTSFSLVALATACWAVFKSIRRGYNKRSIVANAILNGLLGASFFFLFSAIDVLYKTFPHDRIGKVFTLIKRVQECPHYREQMPPVIRAKLDSFVDAVKAVPLFKSPDSMRQRHELVLQFYHDVESQVPVHVKEGAQSCHGDPVRQALQPGYKSG